MKEEICELIDPSRYGIHKVRLPLPFKLDHVNCFAIKGDTGWSIIDAGLNTALTRQHWLEFMKEHGFGPMDVEAVYLTHYHPDHFGAAGWLQEICGGVPVYMHATEAEAAARMWHEESKNTLTAMFLENGMPQDVVITIAQDITVMSSMTMPHPETTPLEGGEMVRLGARDFRVVLTPGHADAHLCFHDEETGILLSGDHLLPHISSNISIWPLAHPDPLDNFFTSLVKNHRLNISIALPAHGEYFTDVQKRVTELEDHHRQRLELMWNHASSGKSAFAVCRDVFGDSLSTHEVRFAMTETLAHLVYMERRGRLKRSRVNGVFWYSA